MSQNQIKPLSFTEETISQVKYFPLPHHEIDFNFKANTMINNFATLREFTVKELANYFTLGEAKLLICAFHGYNHPNTFPPVSLLVSRISEADSFSFYDLSTTYGVKIETLLEKVAKLTQFQAYVVMTLAFEILLNHKQFTDENVCNTFLISR